jgi:hypothetical protein
MREPGQFTQFLAALFGIAAGAAFLVGLYLGATKSSNSDIGMSKIASHTAHSVDILRSDLADFSGATRR